MTKKELEEKVLAQAVRIAELEQKLAKRDIELAAMSARNAAPVAAVQRPMLMKTTGYSNNPWPNFCVATTRAVKR